MPAYQHTSIPYQPLTFVGIGAGVGVRGSMSYERLTLLGVGVEVEVGVEV